jgi:hypothetical protein
MGSDELPVELKLHIDPDEAVAAQKAALVYAIAASPQHDFDGHYECGRRMTSILDALAASKLRAEDNPGLVGHFPELIRCTDTQA